MTRVIRQIALQARNIVRGEARRLSAVRRYYETARYLELNYARYNAPAYLRRQGGGGQGHGSDDLCNHERPSIRQ